uniref:Uncharacterized protein n=1 Tax=Setaria viridis TaxID=4556 RepID=A0A4U6UB37_SETVI|nr:hypothetical protein SEVIR_5G076933v2 [Setaria viridis]TKW13091.1 hypothetical protein SEVIR_5G076933v2 [Setaria viridis]
MIHMDALLPLAAVLEMYQHHPRFVGEVIHSGAVLNLTYELDYSDGTCYVTRINQTDSFFWVIYRHRFGKHQLPLFHGGNGFLGSTRSHG